MALKKAFNYNLTESNIIDQQGLAASTLGNNIYLSTTRHIHEVDVDAGAVRLQTSTGLSPTPGLMSFVDDNCIQLVDGQGNIRVKATVEGVFPANFKHTYDTSTSMIYYLNLGDAAYSGVPRPSYYVKGKKYRTVASGGAVSSTKVFTANAANKLLDYLIETDRYGPRDFTADDVDLPSFYAAQEVAGHVLSHGSAFAGETYPSELNTAGGTSFSTWGDYFADVGINALNPSGLAFDKVPYQIDRFKSSATDTDIEKKMMLFGAYNGHLETVRDFPAAIDTIVRAIPGAIFFKRLTGKYALSVVPITGTVESVITLTDSDLIGSVNVQAPDTDQQINRMIIQYTAIENDYDTGEDIEIPSASTQLRAQLTALDDIIVERRQRLPFVNNKLHATMHAIHRILLSRRRTLNITVKQAHVALELGDVISLNTNTLDIPTTDQWRIVGITTNPDSFTLDCIEFKQSDYYPYLTDKYNLIL